MFTLSTLMQSAPSVLGTEWGACCTQYWCPCSQWGSAMYMMCPGLVSRKEEGRELEMEGWSERWVIFSLRHCCFPPSPVIFTQKWMPGSGWKKGSFFFLSTFGEILWLRQTVIKLETFEWTHPCLALFFVFMSAKKCTLWWFLHRLECIVY